MLGDVHFPYQSVEAVDWAVGMARLFKPDKICQVGDLYDQFSFSRYPKLLKRSPDEELTEARQGAVAMWAALRRARPKAQCYQLTGNHDSRILKKAIADVPELAPLVGRSLRELFTFPGVKSTHSEQQELILDGISFQHGHLSKLGDHARYNQSSTVCGHSHTGGVVFLRNRCGVYWELNAGFLGDVHSEAFSYHAQRVMHRCTLGVGYIDDFGPRFVSYGGK